MILLDTNVISELMKQQPDAGVVAWIGRQSPAALGITTITIAEIERGLARLPKGRRRQRLEVGFAAFVKEGFIGRIDAFDEESARVYGQIAAKREAEGFNTDAVDLMIAAIAKVHNASVATRNTKDFDGCDLKVINPWQSAK
jgi:predicted nucleic acid-binding protein